MRFPSITKYILSFSWRLQRELCMELTLSAAFYGTGCNWSRILCSCTHHAESWSFFMKMVESGRIAFKRHNILSSPKNEITFECVFQLKWKMFLDKMEQFNLYMFSLLYFGVKSWNARYALSRIRDTIFFNFIINSPRVFHRVYNLAR